MQTPIPLYFDYIKESGEYASTQNTRHILYNLNQIDNTEYDDFMEYLDEKGKTNRFLAAGRFLVMLSVDYDRRIGNMLALDLKNDKDKIRMAREGVRKVSNNDSIALNNFGIAVRVIKYKEEYGKFILLQGEPPRR